MFRTLLTSVITISAPDITSGSTATISITLSDGATGNVELYINTNEYYEKKAITTPGSISFTVTGLTTGTKSVLVNYLGDNTYTSGNNTTSFEVSKPKVTNFTTRWAKTTYPNTYSSMTQVPQEGMDYLNSVKPDRLVSLFDGCNSLTSVDVTNMDVSECVNLRYIFDYCKALISLDLSTWDTSKVTFMESMFLGCTNLQIIDLSGWDTTSVTASDAMEYMFSNCTNLQYLILGDADHIFNMIDSGCGSLNNTCKILVPQSVLNTYKAATNWSLRASQFDAIENYTITRSNGQVTVTPN